MSSLIVVSAGAQVVFQDQGDLVPTGKGWGEHQLNAPTAKKVPGAPLPTKADVTYHGGPIMTGTVCIYYIWYGNWSGNTGVSILTDEAQCIGGTAWYNINTTYTNNSGTHVSNSVAYCGSTTDNYSRGTVLSDSAVAGVVSSALSSGRLPYDSHGVYFVLTSPDVTASSGFCSSYCGWHTHGSMGGVDIKYAFIGDPALRCMGSCAAQANGPNCNPGADAMASTIAHEISEAVTDPDLNAWYDSSGAENADKCAWTFGITYSAGCGKANVHWCSRDFLIQRNWVHANGGYCSLSYP